MLKNPRVLLPLGLLALLSGYVLAFPPARILGTDLASCPFELAGMTGTDLGLDQTVLDDLDPDDYLVRSYDRPDGLPVWVVIVYFQNARLGAHDPQLCYRSQGFGITDLPEETIDTALGPVPVLRFRAVKGSRSELVHCFWFTAGGQTLSDVKGWRDRMFFQGLRSNRSFGAFIRVSSIESGEPAAAARAIQEVIGDLAPNLPRFFPEEAGEREDRG